MGRYMRYERRSPVKAEIHPIWRGIGCILMVVVPLISYTLMAILTPGVMLTGLVPHELLGRVQFPDWVYRTSVLGVIASYIGRIDDLWVKLILFLVILLVLSGIFSFGYTLVFQVIGPPRYTALDAPPPKYKPKVYKR